MKRTTVAALLTVAATLAASSPAAAQRKATAEDGEQVLLYDDGTWRSAEQLSLEKVKVTVLKRPPFAARPARGSAQARLTRVRLKQTSAKRNQITDDAAWFSRHDLALPVFEVPNSFRQRKGTCPGRTPTAYRGNKLVAAIRGAGQLYLVYGRDFSSGRYLVITDEALKQVRHVIDFAAYTGGGKDKPADRSFVFQQITWVAERDGVLYIATGHNTYASSSGGRNAYITALNADTLDLIWRSRPLVCNARNFEIVGDAVICGYGFTAEPDYMYVLDRATGKVAQRLKLKTGPSFILRRGSALFVRTYNMDYKFRITGAPSAPIRKRAKPRTR